MIGLALVTLVATLAAGIVAAVHGCRRTSIFTGDYAITAQNNFDPIPIDAAEAAAKAPGVEAVGSVRTGDALRASARQHDSATAVDPGHQQGDHARLGRGRQHDDFDDLGQDGAFVDKDYAKNHDLEVGSPVESPSRTAITERFTLKGIFDPPPGGSPFGAVTISSRGLGRRTDSDPKNIYSFVKMEGGETDANLAALDEALEAVPEREGADAAGVHRQPDLRAQARSSTSSTSCSRSRSSSASSGSSTRSCSRSSSARARSACCARSG